MKQFVYFVVTAVSAFFFLADAQASDAQKITFCRPDNMVSALAFIADAQRFFRDEKLDVTFQTASNAKICQDSIVAGKAYVMTGGEGLLFTLVFPTIL